MSDFDGTLSALIVAYKADKVSDYQRIRYRTRQNYDGLCKRIDFDYGSVKLSEIKYRTVKLWHQQWTVNGKHIAMAHSLVGMLRTLIGFGLTILEDDECERLAAVLRRLKCPMPGARKERLTADQAIAIRRMAHARGLHSLALAQAFQFECMLRQKDVIGEYVPVDEPGTSDVLWHGEKWLRGLRWSEIDANLVLRHVTSKRNKEIEIDLWSAPMVFEELTLLGDLKKFSGPVIVYERTERPYHAFQFRTEWRACARAAGIPDAVFNMDSRAGAISEATDAGAPLENVRHAATHSDITTTTRYSRGSTEKIAAVQQARVAHRSKAR